MITAAVQELRQCTNLTRLAAPLLPFLAQRTTLDVVVNADESVWVNRLGLDSNGRAISVYMTARCFFMGSRPIRRIVFDHDHPIVETIFPLTRDRIEGLISPVVDGVVLAIRTRQKQIFSLSEMTDAGILSNKADSLNTTVQRLQLPPSLYKYLNTTNLIESPQAGVQTKTNNVTRWKPKMAALESFGERWKGKQYRGARQPAGGHPSRPRHSDSRCSETPGLQLR